MKEYIAGHRGFVGSATHRKLKEKGHSDIVCRTSRDLDLRRQADTERFFEEERPGHVYHVAAKVGAGPTIPVRRILFMDYLTRMHPCRIILGKIMIFCLI